AMSVIVVIFSPPIRSSFSECYQPTSSTMLASVAASPSTIPTKTQRKIQRMNAYLYQTLAQMYKKRGQRRGFDLQTE
ncbi:hypothetical protein AMECASPLE_026167, partial [Ameca splendens]